jgi:outer membrane protein
MNTPLPHAISDRLRTVTHAAIVACAALAPAHAETLHEGWIMALQSDQSLAASELQSEAARNDIGAARGLRLPTITASGSFVQFDDAPAFDFSQAGLPLQLPELVDDDNAVVGSVMASLPLFTSGRISSGIDAAVAQHRGAEAAHVQAAQDLKLAVAQSYVDVLRARRALEVADSNVTSLEAYLTEVRALFDRETVPRNDLLAAEVALANARQNRIRAANAASLAQASYNRRLGQPLDRTVSLQASLPALAAQPRSLEQLTSQALARRAELIVLEARAAATGHLAAAERARALPQLQLSAGYTHLENQALDRENFATASIGFQWSLFDGGATRNRAAALRQRQRALERTRADSESLIALEVRRAVLDREETRSRLATTSDAVVQAEENLRITRQQYQAGLVISTRVFEAETLRIVSRTNYDNAVLDADLAQYRLAYSVGEL